MMKKSRLLFLCAVLTATTLFAVGCGNNGDMNGTEAPYEDETNRKVNESRDETNDSGTMNGDTSNGGTSNDGTSNGGTSNGGTSNGGTSNGGTSNGGTTSNGMTNNGADTDNNGAVEGDLERSGSSLRDAGRNLLDSVEETGDAIRDGIDNLGNDVNNNNNTNHTNDTNNTNSTNGTNNTNNAGTTNR